MNKVLLHYSVYSPILAECSSKPLSKFTSSGFCILLTTITAEYLHSHPFVLLNTRYIALPIPVLRQTHLLPPYSRFILQLSPAVLTSQTSHKTSLSGTSILLQTQNIPFSLKFNPPQLLPLCLPKHFILFSPKFLFLLQLYQARQDKRETKKKSSSCSVLGRSPSSKWNCRPRPLQVGSYTLCWNLQLLCNRHRQKRKRTYTKKCSIEHIPFKKSSWKSVFSQYC